MQKKSYVKAGVRMALGILAAVPVVNRRFCCLCERHSNQFLPYRNGWSGCPPLMRALDVVGSDLDNFECPRCGSHDRERHVFLYLQAEGLLDRLKDAHILHFAPEKRLSTVIAKQHPSQYVKCDMFPTAADIERVDMLNIPYEQGHFDMLIANHVLEHVNDIHQAIKEIHRVLKVDGYAILQTPYSAKLQSTWFDPGIDTDFARLHAYGQEDHVRLFGQDIFELFCSTGLSSRVLNHESLLPEMDAAYMGLNAREPFFLFQKS